MRTAVVTGASAGIGVVLARADAWFEEHVLGPGVEGVVEPEVPHEVEPLGPVRFFVEFLRLPGKLRPAGS